mgnify:CR=1 FL=1
MGYNTVSIGNQGFDDIRENKYFYIDKTGLIKEWWSSGDAVTLITRPRRFGKTLNMSMLNCFFSNRYADRGDLFEGLSVWEDENYRQLQGTYPVIFLSFADVKQNDLQGALWKIKKIIFNIYQQYAWLGSWEGLMAVEREQFVGITPDMEDTAAQSAIQDLCSYLSRYYKKKVIVILDEYDTPMQEAYIHGYWDEFTAFMRSLFNATFKTNPYLERAVMTGITRVSKESIFSDLNNLAVVTTTSDRYSTAFGFTQEEVFKSLDDMGLGERRDDVKRWYDGYLLKDYQVYNPRAVVSVMMRDEFKSYWSETASYDVVVPLINMNFDGLKTAIIEMLSGAEVKVNTATFQNDVEDIKSKDDVLTYMIHLGYLGYNEKKKTAFVPNEEIRQELTTAVGSTHWNEMLLFQQESEQLLDATLDMDGKEVAKQIEKIHNEYVSVIQYNNENSLSSVLAIAYLSAMQYYFKPIRELPTGRGFADFVFVPKPEYKADYPALIVELKWNQNVSTALNQVKDKKYVSSILNYTGDILLVGINYDKSSKKHDCLIESYSKQD